MSVKKKNRTIIIPLLRDPPDISEVVVNPETFSEEAKFLGSFSFATKNILSTHRNLMMTVESHQTVFRLFLGYSKRLLEVYTCNGSKKPLFITNLANRMNECADELVKKSSYYPAQATRLKKELMKSNEPIRVSLGRSIEPHEEFISEVAPISMTVMRGSHLIRSLLNRQGLFLRASEAIPIAQNRFKKACKKSGIKTPNLETLNDIRATILFLRTEILPQLLWWRKDYENN